MSNTHQAKQQLAELLDERQSRTQAAQGAQAGRDEATRRLSQLRASQALDGLDLSKRITAAEADITRHDALLATWTDVEAELERRVQSAKSALLAAGNADLLAELAELQAAERGRRLAFAEAIHDAAQSGRDLRLLLNRKSVIAGELYAAGVVVQAGDGEMGHHPRYFGEQSAIDAARRLVDEYAAY